MKKFGFALFFFALLAPLSQAQNTEEELAVKKVIMQMFDGMRAGDSSVLSPLFLPDATLNTYLLSPNNETSIMRESTQDFVNAVGTAHDKVWDERIWSYDIRIDGPLASAWTEYTFFLGKSLHHCGVNHFLLCKQNGVWRIAAITDTRRKNDCLATPPDETTAVNALIDGWHLAAATADEDAFFGAMTPDGVYLGTDATERWLRDELRSWAVKAFERKSAWDFKPHHRQLYFAEDGLTAWWEELLDTWMGPCRGSGVAQKTPEGWKIKHFNLSIMVPNDKVQAFLKLMKK